MLHTEEENNYCKLYFIFKIIAICVKGTDVNIVTF